MDHERAMCGADRNHIHNLLLHLTENTLHVECFLLGNSSASEFYVPTFRDTLLVPSSQAVRYEYGKDSVPKRRHIKFRRRGIAQKKAYNIQNTQKFEIKNNLHIITL